MDVRGTLAAAGEGGNAGTVPMSGMLLPQPLEPLQASAVAFGRNLKEARNILESWIIYQPPERKRADFALADVLVTVNPRAERLHRIVQVERFQPLDPQQCVEFAEGLVEAPVRGDVVSGGEDVTRIDTNPDAAAVVDRIDDRSELFERAADARTLSGRGLEQCDYAMIRNRGVNFVE